MPPKSCGPDHLAPNDVYNQWLTKHYSRVIGETMGELKRPDVPVQLVSDLLPANPHESDPIHLSPDETATFAAVSLPPLPGPAGLNPRYTFDSFIVGSSNQFAHP